MPRPLGTPNGFTMADFKAEMHRRKHGEHKGQRRRWESVPVTPPPVARGRKGGRRESWPVFVERTIAAAAHQVAVLARVLASERLPDPRDPHATITVGALGERYRSLITWLKELG